jgi:hypothetical protein
MKSLGWIEIAEQFLPLQALTDPTAVRIWEESSAVVDGGTFPRQGQGGKLHCRHYSSTDEPERQVSSYLTRIPLTSFLFFCCTEFVRTVKEFTATAVPSFMPGAADDS